MSTQTNPWPIARIIQQTPQSRHIEFAISNSSFAHSYKTPGQYCLIEVPGFKPGYFALSSKPNSPWSFLIKDSSPLTSHLSSLKEGEGVPISQAMGKGFDINPANKRNVLLFAAGSGIAPIRALLLELLEKKLHGSITLFYGARNPDEFAYEKEFQQWVDKGAKVVPTISNKSHSNWKQAFGYVQHLIPKQVRHTDTTAYICGMKAMVDEVKENLRRLGMTDPYLLTNF